MVWWRTHGFLRAIGATVLAGAVAINFQQSRPFLATFVLLAITMAILERRRGLWALIAVFLLWANLHGGFVGGLLLIALVGAGTLLEQARARRAAAEPQPSWRRGLRPLALIGLTGLAAAGATFATPLGPKVWEYVLSFRNPAISVATQEWEPAVQSPPILIYVLVAGAFTAWLWHNSPRPRPITPLVVAVGFLALTLYSQRNVALLGPVMLYLIALCAPDRAQAAQRRSPVVVVGLAAVAATAVWAFALGPAQPAPYLKPRLVDAVLRHPPQAGRIAAVAGVGSYLLWRAARTPVVINGWLEHYTSNELRGAYAVLRPTPASLRYIKAWKVDGVITRSSRTVSWLRAHGFRVVAATSEGTYLER
jgi:hypothetical protein